MSSIQLTPAAVDAAVSDYLGDDLAATVAAASLLGDPVLSALATASPAKRLPAVEKFRVGLVASAINSDLRLRRGYEILRPDVQLKARAGKWTMGEVVDAANEALLAAGEAAMAARRDGMSALKAALHSLHLNPDTARVRGVPTDLVILADGSVSFHPNRREAKEHGRASGLAWFHAPLNREMARFNMPDPAVALPAAIEDAAAAGAEEPEPVKVAVNESGELLPV